MPFVGFPVFPHAPRDPSVKMGRSSPRLPTPSRPPTPNLPAAPCSPERAPKNAAAWNEPRCEQRAPLSAACPAHLPCTASSARRMHADGPAALLSLLCPPAHASQVGPPRLTTGERSRAPKRSTSRTCSEQAPANRRCPDHGRAEVATLRRSPLVAFPRFQRAATVRTTSQPHEETETVVRAPSQPLRVCLTPETLMGFPPSGLCSTWRSGPVSAPHPPLPLGGTRGAASTPEA